MEQEQEVYLNQSKLTISINTGIDCTNATVLKIKYKKPDGVKGEWTAELSEDDPKIVKHKVAEGEINAVGSWTIWSHVTFSDGSVPGKPAKMLVKNEGE